MKRPPQYELDIVDCLKNHGTIDCQRIADKTGHLLQSITPRMVPLERRGLIRRVGKGVNLEGNPATLWRWVPPMKEAAE